MDDEAPHPWIDLGTERMLRRSLATPPLDADQAGRIQARARDEWRALVAPRHRAPRWWAAAAALVAVTAAGLIYPLLPAAPPVADFSGGERGSLLRVAAFRRTAVVADHAPLRAATTLDARGIAALNWRRGGSIRVGPGTRLRLVDAQTVALEYGAVYIASPEPHAADALTIRTPLGTISHFGTRFVVIVDNERVQLAVHSGSVSFVGASTIKLHANQTLQVSPENGAVTGTLNERAPAFAFETQPVTNFDAEGRTVAALLAWASAERGLRLEFADEDARALAAGTILHGSIAGLDVDAALDQMLATTTLHWNVQEDELRVQSTHARADRR